jgi:hypothetical protein
MTLRRITKYLMTLNQIAVCQMAHRVLIYFCTIVNQMTLWHITLHKMAFCIMTSNNIMPNDNMLNNVTLESTESKQYDTDCH